MSDERLIPTGEVTKIYNKRAVYHPPPPLLRKESYTVIIDSNGQVINAEEDLVPHECNDKCVSSLLHSAARTGNVEEIELLLESGADPNKRDCMGRTPLHWAVIMGCNCDSCKANRARCTQLLVDSPKTAINLQDFNGDTPLHLAAEHQAIKCASILLYSGADVSIKSKEGTKALTLMVDKIPETLDSLMSRAVTVEKFDTTSVNCELKLDFGAIVGYSDNRWQSLRPGKNCSKETARNFRNIPRKEMHLLTLIVECSSSARKKILMHPLIAIFLHLKWRRVRAVFWATIGLHVALLMMYTLYILDVYLISCPYRPKITEPAAVKAAKDEGNFLQNGNSTYRAEFIKFSWFKFSPQLQELGTIKSSLHGDGCPLEIGPTVKSVLLLSLTFVMAMNEVFKMLPAPKSYIKRTTNRLQWTFFFFILLTSWPVFMSYPNIRFWQYQAAAFGLLLSWALMLTQIGKFPLLGLYVEILTKVLRNFGFFMITYASLLIAFALAFCVLFPGDAPYSSIPLSLLKVLMMMVGEVNYEEIFYGNENNPVDDQLYPIPGHVLYGAFVIMITIVLMNLLAGLTVSDIQGLQKDAELTRLSRQIAEISQLESLVFSKRIQSFLPNSVGTFLRQYVLVAPPTPVDATEQDEPRYFRVRPYQSSDKTIPEHLKQAILRIAATRHKTRRKNKCMKNFQTRGGTSAPAYIQKFMEQHTKNVEDTTTKRHQNSSNSDTKLGNPSQFTSSLLDAEYFFNKLEEKIMDRVKIQMDTLYQKLEDKMLNQ